MRIKVINEGLPSMLSIMTSQMPKLLNTVCRLPTAAISTKVEASQPETFVQVLPLLKPSPKFVDGGILLCKWKSGNYQARHTGIIENVPESFKFSDSTTTLGMLAKFAKEIIPNEVSPFVSRIKLQGILHFDGPPDSLEYIFVADLNGTLETLTFSENYPYTLNWFNLSRIPYEEMPADDEVWYPLVLDGKKVRGSFVFGGIHERTIKSYELSQVESLSVE